MKNKYVYPTIEVVPIDYTNVTMSSVNDNWEFGCSRYCKHWHYCLDRREGRLCDDKEY